MELTYNEIIICPKITEKSNTYLAHQNKFLFKVHKNTNKAEIKKAIEKIFEKHVVDVNIINVKGKMKRHRQAVGFTKGYKKAIVTLKAGEKFDFIESTD